MSKRVKLLVAFCQILLFTSVLIAPFIEHYSTPYDPLSWQFQDSTSLLILGIVLSSLGALIIGIATHFGLNPRSPFNIFPFEYKPEYLVTTGLYCYIRHPQALGWLIGATGYLIVMNASWSLLLWPICLLFFLIEIPIEEHHLEHTYPEYAAYKDRTKRLIPYVW